MKHLLYLLVMLTCISCNNGTKQTDVDSAKGTPVVGSNTEQQNTLTPKEKLIKALQKLQQDIASKDKETIAAYFQFPLQSDALQVFDVNENFDKQVAQNNHLISRSLFLTHFDALYDNLEMRGFTELFNHLQLDKLKDTTTIQADVKNAKDVCTHFYNITTAGKEVTLEYGVYTNEEYTGKQSKDEPEECAEYAAFWTFIFDGEKLIFNRHQVAG